MKTPEELNAIKTEVKELSKKLSELSEDELIQATGGVEHTIPIPKDGEMWHSWNPSPLFDDNDLRVLQKTDEN